jgi:hypothetical protein
MKTWFHAAGIRALRTAAQVAILAIAYQTGNSIVEGGFNVFTMDWLFVLGFSLGGAVLSMLTSVTGLPEVDDKE